MWNTLLDLGSTAPEPSLALGLGKAGCSPLPPSQGQNEKVSVPPSSAPPERRQSAQEKSHTEAGKEREVGSKAGIVIALVCA